MSDEARICPHCGTQQAGRWRLDPDSLRAGRKLRPVCGNCHSKMVGDPIAARTAGNFKRAGTSQEAAASAALVSPKTCALILRQLCLDDLTPDEIARICEINLLTARPRCSDLRNKGYIKPTGQRRRTDANKDAEVMMITNAGRDWLAEQMRVAA